MKFDVEYGQSGQRQSSSPSHHWRCPLCEKMTSLTLWLPCLRRTLGVRKVGVGKENPSSRDAYSESWYALWLHAPGTRKCLSLDNLPRISSFDRQVPIADPAKVQLHERSAAHGWAWWKNLQIGPRIAASGSVTEHFSQLHMRYCMAFAVCYSLTPSYVM